MMIKTLRMLTLASLAVLSLQAETGTKDNDYVKKAILKGKADVLKAYVRANLAVAKETKEAYVELAKEQVENRRKQIGTITLKGIVGVDLALALTTGVVLAAASIETYDKYDKAEKITWTNKLVVSGLVAKFVGDCLKLYKDLQKTDKAHEKLEKAEKVLRAAQALITK